MSGQLVQGATAEEQQRGLALADAADHCKRAAAALQAARTGETDATKISILDRALDSVRRTHSELDPLR